jgi:ornithine decarboxylase
MSTVTATQTRLPTWSAPTATPSASTQIKANDMIHILDANTKLPYIPSHSLPTPPPSSPPVVSYDPNSPALEYVSDTPLHQLVQDAVTSRAVHTLEGEVDEAAFFAADLSAVYEAVKMWRDSAIGDRVEIFYAVKCNPSPVVLHLLSLLGTSFDCASTAEIKQVLSLPSAPDPSRIIFANPCKPASFIRAAAEHGVAMMTFDNADELHKIKRAHPLDTCPGLLRLASQLGLNVVGVSFHVGSGCKDPMQFADAVWRAKRVFDMGKEAGYGFRFLDVGGGFERETFKEMSEVVRDALDLYFPVESGVRVVAEPGRLLVSIGQSLPMELDKS